MIVALFFLTNVRYGGFVSYTTHLCRALEAEGHTPMLYRIASRDEKKSRPFADGVDYVNVSLEHASVIAKSYPSAVVCAYEKQFPTELEALIRCGAAWVIHDPTELRSGDAMTRAKQARRVVAIRSAMTAHLADAGITAKYAPHPYVRQCVDAPRVGRFKACAVSRFDWDKNVDIALEACAALPTTSRIEFHGYANTLYVSAKLAPHREIWDAQYRGAFARIAVAATDILSRYQFAVDLSTISGDGGGTQYSFLEAWDAGCDLIVHRKWLAARNNSLVEGVDCYAAESAQELVDTLLASGSVPLPGAKNRLDAHCPGQTVPAFLDAIE